MISRSLSKAIGRGIVALAATIPLDAAQLIDPDRGQSEAASQDIDALRHAGARGDADAQYQLADAYSNYRVESMEDAEAEAMRWYRLAAEQGHAAAQFQLGLRHEQGWGVAQDHVQAYMWLSLAVARSSGEDRDRNAHVRDRVAEEMTTAQISEAMKLAREWKPAAR